MDNVAEQPKKCFCARCFMPIEEEDKVTIEGQNFHRMCGTCCICRTAPTSLKMFYGHVFCAECFKNHVLNRFKGEHNCTHQNNWWMQWAQQGGESMDSTEKPNEDTTKPESDSSSTSKPENIPKRCICARCLQACDEKCKVEIDGQYFHPQCARCYFCRCVPTNNVKIYYGQVFCEECFNRRVLGKNKDNPSEFYKSCFEQWQNNPQFSEHMQQFMASSANKARNARPFPAAAAPPPVASVNDSSWDLSFENRTDTSDPADSYESAKHDTHAIEKIEKLTKYFGNSNLGKPQKKWKIFTNPNVERKTHSLSSEIEVKSSVWTDLRDPKINQCCPACLWQCGPIFVNCDYFEK